MDFDKLNRAVKFGADGEQPPTDRDLQNFLKRLNYSREDREGGKDADHNFRLVLADKLQDHGRDHEAALLRDGHPVRVEGLDLDFKSEDGIRYTGGQIKPNYEGFVWPGGVPLIYHHEKNRTTVCSECLDRKANERAAALAKGEEPETEHPREYETWTHEEGPPFECDECNNQIEAAYGDPDNPEDYPPE